MELNTMCRLVTVVLCGEKACEIENQRQRSAANRAKQKERGKK